MNKIYKVIFNRARGMYQVVSEIAKSVSSKKSETIKIKNACLAVLILLAVGGTGNMYTSYAAEPSGSTTATAPENQDIALLKRLLQELQDKQAAQSNIIHTQEGQIQAHGTALNAYNQSLRNFEISLQANKDAINDITKAGGKLDQTIDQVNTMLDATGQGMQRLQESQRTNSGAIKQLQTSVADITKQGGLSLIHI